jgi:hypothetical protein
MARDTLSCSAGRGNCGGNGDVETVSAVVGDLPLNMPVDLVVSIGLQAVAVSPAPEPSAYSLLLTGLMVLFAIDFARAKRLHRTHAA